MHETKLGGTTCIILPKLSKAQMKAMATGLESKGFRVKLPAGVMESRNEVTAHVDPVGSAGRRRIPQTLFSPCFLSSWTCQRRSSASTTPPAFTSGPARRKGT